ncbi:hypothetical protein [Rhizobium leguminosarum]
MKARLQAKRIAASLRAESFVVDIAQNVEDDQQAGPTEIYRHRAEQPSRSIRLDGIFCMGLERAFLNAA